MKATPPVFGDTAISICPDLTRQYYYTVERWDGDTLLNTEESTTKWAIRAQMAIRHYSMYKDVFFTQVIGPTGKFLTWQPDAKLVRVDQPERLYFLTNFSPSPLSLKLRVRVCYSDNSFDTFTASQVDNVTPMTVYCVPVGYSELNLAARPKAVIWYETWLTNENTQVVSETRTYRVDRLVYESVKAIIFQNSLGGYDTLRCVGSVQESVTVSRQLLERFADYDYLPTVSDVLINSITGERQITVNIGNWLNSEYREYLEELILSEDFYIVDSDEFIPLTPSFNQMITDSNSEWPIERTLTFTYSNPIGGYSRLPKIVAPARAISWQQYSESCELTSFGVRSGRRIVNELVKVYADNGEYVRPLITKANVPGTEGYISPWYTSICDPSTTPYLNTMISGPSVLKRNNCAVGLVGRAWTIQVHAGVFGSQISQADAQAKAQAAWYANDTQESANIAGICSLPMPIRLGIKNLCEGDGSGNHLGLPVPIMAILINDIEVIPDTGYTGSTVTYAVANLDPGLYNIDVRITAAGPMVHNYKFIYYLPGGTLSNSYTSFPFTQRLANLNLYDGDPDVIIAIEFEP